MDIYKLIHLLIRNAKLLVVIPLVAGALMFVLTMKQTLKYSTKASVFTAITAKSSLNETSESPVDFFATKTAYNNLLSILTSRNVMEETSLRLLALHLVMDSASPAVISQKSFDELASTIKPRLDSLVVKSNAEKTYRNLQQYTKQDKDNFVYNLLNFDHPHYSYKSVSQVKALQDGGSDIVLLSFQSNDPGVAYQTLSIFIDVFLRTYGDLKKNQTSAVVDYFERQLRNSSAQLNDAEDRLLEFNKTNNIINYYEQTKHISSQQEKIDLSLQDAIMNFRATEAVLARLEDETRSRFSINLKTKTIMNLRQQLIDVNQKITASELTRGDSLAPVSFHENMLTRDRATIELKLRSSIDSLNVFDRNSDGLALETLLKDWLKTVVEYEAAKAKLQAMRDKTSQFSELYVRYAPMGANLKRIEREIDVKEKEYLEILHHLGLARLKQQNEELMANMKILDKPQFPIDPEPTKRKLFIIVIVLFATVFTLLGLVLLELLDKTIRGVKHLADTTGLDVAGAIGSKVHFDAEHIDSLDFKGLKRVLEDIVNQRCTSPGDQPLVIQVMSNWQGDGKSYFVNHVSDKLRQLGFTTAIVQFDTNEPPQANPFTVVIPPGQTFACRSYAQLCAPYQQLATDVVLVEIPDLCNNLYNNGLLHTATMSFFVVDAFRVWTSADQHLYSAIMKHPIANLYGVVNRVKPDEMESFLGEMPKKRSRLRTFIKQRIFKRFIS